MARGVGPHAMAEQLGRYILDRRIAAGGMAEVFLARQSGPGGFEKVCVIKRMLSTLTEDTQFIRMFLDEAKLAAYLNHPNIAQIFDFGEVNGTYYLAMEYVPGATLRQIVKEHTRAGEFLPVHLAARMVSQAAVALDYAHNATDSEGNPLDIIHRDVSPQNILLGNTGVVKLIDFGVAKAASASVKTATGMIKGKFAYMSPEQLRGKPLDRRSDVYGLGFVLYELLAGSRAIQGTTDAQMMDAALHRRFDPIEERRPDVPVALKAIIDRALAKDRGDRYDNCAQMSVELERYLLSVGVTVTGQDLVKLLSEEARSPLRPSADPGAGATRSPSAPAVVAPKVSSGEFWSQPAEDNQGTQVDPDFQPPGTAVPRDPPALRRREDAANAPTVTQMPRPQLLGGGRTPSGPSQPAAVIPAADDSMSLLRKAGLQRTFTPYLVAAAAVVAILGGIGYLLFGDPAAKKVDAPVVAKHVETPKPVEPPVVRNKPVEAAVVEKKPVVVEKPVEKKPVVLAKPPKETAAPKGMLHVTSNPPTTIFVDGVSVGRTPVEAQVSAGDHQLLFKDDRLKLEHLRHVRVERGDTRREDWRVGKGRVAFRVVPFGEVYLNEQWVGLTPLPAMELYEGEYSFRFINKETGKKDARVVKVEPDKETVVKVDLRGGS